MAASQLTVAHLAQIVRQHVAPACLESLCRELETVKGNKSFRTTRNELVKRLRRVK